MTTRRIVLRGGPANGATYVDVFVPNEGFMPGVHEVVPFIFVGPLDDGRFAKYEFKPGSAPGSFHVNDDGEVRYQFRGFADKPGEPG